MLFATFYFVFTKPLRVVLIVVTDKCSFYDFSFLAQISRFIFHTKSEPLRTKVIYIKPAFYVKKKQLHLLRLEWGFSPSKNGCEKFNKLLDIRIFQFFNLQIKQKTINHNCFEREAGLWRYQKRERARIVVPYLWHCRPSERKFFIYRKSFGKTIEKRKSLIVHYLKPVSQNRQPNPISKMSHLC